MNVKLRTILTTNVQRLLSRTLTDSSGKSAIEPPPFAAPASRAAPAAPSAPDAPAELGHEQSEASYEAWRRYWTAEERDHSAGIMDVGHGYKMDWSLPGGGAGVGVGGGGGGSASGAASGADADADGVDGADGGGRWFFALRHGERVDLTYGRWLPHCVSGDCYVRRDLNMPLALPQRAGGLAAFGGDSPLTRVGALQAALAGEGLRLAGVRARHVYCSAALRCVETAHHFLKGMEAGPEVKIRVEPGLFECKLWHAARGLPPFMTPRELAAAGYHVDLDYTPYVQLDVTSSETLEDYYKRSERVMHSAIRDTENDGGNIVFVGHAATLDTMAIALAQLGPAPPPRAPYAVSAGLLRVPYCALAAARGRPARLVPPPCPPCANSSSGRFDWRTLLDK